LNNICMLLSKRLLDAKSIQNHLQYKMIADTFQYVNYVCVVSVSYRPDLIALFSYQLLIMIYLNTRR